MKRIDRYHLNERLAEILRLVEPDERRWHQRLRRWNTMLDADDGAIARIARWIAQQIPAYDGKVLATLEAPCTYVMKNNDSLRDATLRRAGLPCGSGDFASESSADVQVAA